jgi:uncharacterized membrane protein
MRRGIVMSSRVGVENRCVLSAVRRSLVLQLVVLGLSLILVATVIGLITLWPDGSSAARKAPATSQPLEHATVEAVRRIECAAPGRFECARVMIRVRSGPDEGQLAGFTIGETTEDIRVSVGDRIRVFRLPGAASASAGGVRLDRYGFSDYERQRPLAWLTVIFCLVVVAAGRLRALRALVGLGLSLLIVVWFVVPAILDGGDPVGVALAGALAVMFVTIPLAHGLGAKAVAAMLGTAAAIGLTALLASIATDAVHLTGISSDEASYLHAIAGDLSLQGLLLAGMIIGALGVLDDLTVSQASTVMALRRASPQLSTRRVIHEALDVGHDHIAATVNTLVLAYVGASLPVLLIFSLGGWSFGQAINTEAVAEQVVAMIVGSIGLIAAVPITTWLAAVIASELPPESLAGSTHEHAHEH